MRILTILIAILTCISVSHSRELDISPSELRDFMDGVMNAQLVAYDIPGAAVAIVKDGKLFFSEGYGYADLDGRARVTPDSTLFRIGSVSKIFVWTSVMQLVERGELDLHADVNTYLEEFRIPDAFDEPITLAHLLTHTPGFEEQELGVFVRDSSEIASLGEYLALNIPARVRPPGQLSSYSNYGTALAAYIVQEVSGTPFPLYVEQNIYLPLGMGMSSFLQPPPGLTDLLATGYVPGPGISIAQPFEWVQAYPAGSMSSTAEEMARFMIAHLNDGAFRGNRILETNTARDMHSLHFTHDPRVNGWTWGFMELDMGGDSIIWHGGDTYYFHSAMYLLLSYDLGIFVTYNCPAGAKARIDLLKAFIARYMPMDPAGDPVRMEGAGHAAECSGHYLDIRTNFTTPERLTTLRNRTEVVLVDEHTLQFGGIRWVEVEPYAFRNLSSPEMLVFQRDPDGAVKRMFRGNNPTTAYEKLSWLTSPGVQMSIAIACLVVFLSFVLAWPAGFAMKLRKKKRSVRGARAAATLMWLLCFLNAYFLVKLDGAIPPEGFGFGVPEGVARLLALPYLITALTVTATIMLYVAWKKNFWTIWGRLDFTLAWLASVALIPWMSHWNLLFHHFG